jgi:O-succinylbenzoate synthase
MKRAIVTEKVKPQYIILKPSFIGGFRGTQQWISLAEKHQIRWWITSALESNIGLNAIAMDLFATNLMPQGLRTGALYTNNFDCPLEVSEDNFGIKDSEWKFN